MAALNAAPATTAELRMACDFLTSVLDHHGIGADDDRDGLANQAPRHTVGVGVEFDAALGIDPAHELAHLQEGGDSRDRTQVLALELEALGGRDARRAVDAHIGHLALPAREMRLHRRPALEGVT